MGVKLTAKAIFVGALLGLATVMYGMYWVGWAEHNYLFPHSAPGVVGLWALGMMTCLIVGFALFFGFLLFAVLLFFYWAIEARLEDRREKKLLSSMGPGAD